MIRGKILFRGDSFKNFAYFPIFSPLRSKAKNGKNSFPPPHPDAQAQELAVQIPLARNSFLPPAGLTALGLATRDYPKFLQNQLITHAFFTAIELEKCPIRRHG